MAATGDETDVTGRIKRYPSSPPIDGPWSGCLTATNRAPAIPITSNESGGGTPFLGLREREPARLRSLDRWARIFRSGEGVSVVAWISSLTVKATSQPIADLSSTAVSFPTSRPRQRTPMIGPPAVTGTAA